MDSLDTSDSTTAIPLPAPASQHTVNDDLKKIVLTFEMPEYASKMENNEVFYSPTFYTHPGGYKMRIKVNANNTTGVALHAEVLEGYHDSELQWPFRGTIRYELLNQLEDTRHFSIVHDLVLQVNQCSSYQDIDKHIIEDGQTTNTRYFLDDTLYFRVSLKVDNHKPWLVCTEYKCLHKLIAKKDMNILKKDEEFKFEVPYTTTPNMITKSGSFYTHLGGYKMCIEVYPAGNETGSGTHMSVYVRLLDGAYQTKQSSLFYGNVKITLLNQRRNNNHHSREIIFNQTNSILVGQRNGFQEFISRSGLNSGFLTAYIKNNTLLFIVSVNENISN